MKLDNHSNLLKKLAGLVGVVGASVLIGFPSGAQEGVLNPTPGIFNEPPYNRTSPTAPPPEASPTTPSVPSSEEPTTGSASENLVALTASNDSFKVLTAALKAAGLTETLAGEGPFTVFAPNDEAFAALPQDALQQLMQPENKDILVKILTYHVVPGKVTSGDLKSGEVKTVEGGAVNVKVDSATGVTVNDARVLQPDIQASNGVIHVIDRVILPPDL